MLEALNIIGCIVQPFGLCQELENITLEVVGTRMKWTNGVRVTHTHCPSHTRAAI